MSVWEVILVYVCIPLAVVCLVYLLVMASGRNRTSRYRPGQEWTYPAAWWAANPAGLGHGDSHDAHSGPSDPGAEPVRTARGGARGSW